MAQAHGNPEEIRIFAGALENYLHTLEEETGRLDGAFSQVGETWDDPKRHEFEDIYQQLKGVLHTFQETAGEQVPHLRQLADILEQYLSR